MSFKDFSTSQKPTDKPEIKKTSAADKPAVPNEIEPRADKPAK